jgi:hypothetical protein
LQYERPAQGRAGWVRIPFSGRKLGVEMPGTSTEDTHQRVGQHTRRRHHFMRALSHLAAVATHTSQAAGPCASVRSVLRHTGRGKITHERTRLKSTSPKLSRRHIAPGPARCYDHRLVRRQPHLNRGQIQPCHPQYLSENSPRTQATMGRSAPRADLRGAASKPHASPMHGRVRLAQSEVV